MDFEDSLRKKKEMQNISLIIFLLITYWNDNILDTLG